MDENIIPWIILIVVCFLFLGGLTLYQVKARQKREAMSGLEKGRVYQMEDGTLAKYLGDGKYLKVKTDKQNNNTNKGEKL